LNARSKTPLDLFALQIGHDVPLPLEASDKDNPERDAVPMTECAEENSLSLKEEKTQMLADLNTGGKSADVSFQIDNRTISCHKDVLVSRSEYFRELLALPQDPNPVFTLTSLHPPHVPISTCDDLPATNQFSIPGVSFEEFSELVYFLYTSSCRITLQNVASIFHLADHFVIQDLQEMCFHFLNSVLHPDLELVLFFENIPAAILDCVPLMELVGKRMLRFFFGNRCGKEFIGEERLRALFMRFLDLVENKFIFEGCLKRLRVE